MSARENTRVLMLFRGGRDELMSQIERGDAPDEFLYGLPQVAARFGSVQIIEPGMDRNWIDRVVRPFEMLTVQMGFGLFVATPLNRLRALQQARVILATTDSTAMPVLILKRLGLIRGSVVLISQGLHSFDASGIIRRWIAGQLARCLRAASGVVVLGDGDSEALHERFSTSGLPPVEIIQFGIDENFWSPADIGRNARASYALSVGSDVMRDYDTLLRAAAGLPLRLVTRMKLDGALVGPNVTVESALTWPELRQRYREAAFVVTPIKDQPRDSGHSATLQAMACGKAVILSDTAGLWDRQNMVHNETCYLVEPGNSDAMRRAIQHLYSRPDEATRIGRNARSLVERSYTSRQFGTQLASAIADSFTK
jgi:glycosyltransferase involved in cell wall biosynthesis